MARSALRDPLDKYRWTVSIEGFTKLGFHETSVPSYSITTKKYKEGGSHLTPRQIIDTVDYKPVTLTRGVTNDTSFNRWATSFVDLVTNNAGFDEEPIASTLAGGSLPSLAQVSEAAMNNGARAVPSFVRTDDISTKLFNDGKQNLSYRKTVKIEHVGRTGQVEVVYMLYGAFPIEYIPASDFGAMSDDAVSVESITLAYESFEVLYTGAAGAIANLATNF